MSPALGVSPQPAIDDDGDALPSRSTWLLKLSGLLFAGMLVIGRSASYGHVTWLAARHAASTPLVVLHDKSDRAPVPAPKTAPAADPAAMSKRSAADEVVTFSAGPNSGDGSAKAKGRPAGCGDGTQKGPAEAGQGRPGGTGGSQLAHGSGHSNSATTAHAAGGQGDHGSPTAQTTGAHGNGTAQAAASPSQTRAQAAGAATGQVIATAAATAATVHTAAETGQETAGEATGQATATAAAAATAPVAITNLPVQPMIPPLQQVGSVPQVEIPQLSQIVVVTPRAQAEGQIGGPRVTRLAQTGEPPWPLVGLSGTLLALLGIAWLRSRQFLRQLVRRAAAGQPGGL